MKMRLQRFKEELDMNVEMNMYLPPNFLESANKWKNGNQSISEQISRVFLSDIIGYDIADIKRGDDKKNEPDYVVGDNGFEITFGLQDDLPITLKEKCKLPQYVGTIDGYYNGIISAIVNKHSRAKTYCTSKNTLIVFTIEAYLESYAELYKMSERSTYYYTRIRNGYFDKIIKLYTEKNMFDNILIIQPTHDINFAVTDLNAYYRGDDFLTIVSIKRGSEYAFPHCSIIGITDETKPQIIYKRHIIWGERSDSKI